MYNYSQHQGAVYEVNSSFQLLRPTRNPSFIYKRATCARTLPRQNSSISPDITDKMKTECYCCVVCILLNTVKLA